MEDLNAELEVLQSLTMSRTPTFTAVDDLPLERHGSVEFLERFGEPQAQNQYFRGGGDSDTPGELPKIFCELSFLLLSKLRGRSWGVFPCLFDPKRFLGEGISLSGGRVGSRT